VLQNIDSKTPLSWNRSTQTKTLEAVSFLTIELVLYYQEFYDGGVEKYIQRGGI
jgi:hypothetical protein